jgi:hypothetical protein
MFQAILVLALHIVAALILSGAYFRRYALLRPPIGVFNLWDVALMLAGILCVPYLYLLLPAGVVAGLLGLGALGIGYTTVEPVLRRPSWRWTVVVITAVADLICLLHFGAGSTPFLLVNNLLQVLVVIGVANLWAQSGMKARDCALVGAALLLYDVLFTSVLPLMANLFVRLGELPFAPQMGWPLPDGRVLAIGLGDLLLAAVFPLVMRKAYGTMAGAQAILLTVAALAAVLLLPVVLPSLAIFPVMVVLGPLMVGQVWHWRRRMPGERTTWQFRQAEPFPSNGWAR